MNKSYWVDLQVNGHAGVDYSSPDLTAEDVVRSAEALYNAGTEIFLPTIITSSEALYRRNLPLIKHAVEKYQLGKHIPGIHLEGPMITSKGSHDPSMILPCNRENLHFLHDVSEGFIRLLTLSADSPGSVETIQEAEHLGIITSVGHHMAGYADICRAAEAGCSLLTHLGNACPNLLDRHENPLLAGLAEDRMTAMIITDGHHLPAELIRIILKIKGADKVIVTSDACSHCGYPPGEYSLWGNRAILTAEGKLFNPEKHCLVAAASTMGMCMDFLKNLQLLSEEECLKVGRKNALKLLKLAS